jgi:nucleoside-diphosphate-sugar epimerase
VIHFAALIAVGESVGAPAEYFRNNVANTMNLLDAMRESGVSRIVFSSTAAVYGNPQQSLIAEDHPQMPLNPYGESKRSATSMPPGRTRKEKPARCTIRRPRRPVVPRRVWFSRFGTLVATIEAFANQSPRGWFADELADALHVEVQDPLHDLDHVYQRGIEARGSTNPLTCAIFKWMQARDGVAPRIESKRNSNGE